ncbi:hypothetical protein GGI04_002336 [Coemansia thaxteri]|uniref:ER transporter 6TM N-terminal domain-containing protein n=1 Tax=Coemansia thaxteri TaxID=2663907 RepID=A0A9W8BI95_9FUNG|nr:hypothetical protein H4R26_003302 [Coemansia thaxteri]KAJ2005202.1 hypothetical protein GGI04_002336 [Coemansia thaxteri]
MNSVSVFLAMTRYPITRQFTVAPLPGIVYAQLIGAGVSTLVNVFVMPSTSSRKLVGSFRSLLKQMSDCCEYFETSAGLLGQKGHRKSEDARTMRSNLRKRAEGFGQAVGGSRYETTIERFSQLDYHRIFIVANKLAGSFGTMCLPFEIDDEFYHLVQDSSAKMQHGSMTKPTSSSTTSLRSSIDSSEPKPGSINSKHYKTHRRMHSETRIHRHQFERSMAELAETQRRQELRAAGIKQALGPITAQTALHRCILAILLDRSSDMEHGSSTKSLFHLVAFSFRGYRAAPPRHLGATTSTGNSINIGDYVRCADMAEGPSIELRAKLRLLGLDQLATVVEQHIEVYEKAEVACIQMIAPYDNSVDMKQTHEQHIIVLSFIGALRENAICLCNLLWALHEVNEKRPMGVQMWLPKLSWSWLYRGRVDEDDSEDVEPESEDWNLENAFNVDGTESLSDSKSSLYDRRFESDTTGDVSSGHSETEYPEESVSHVMQHPLARAASRAVDWLRRPKTQYAIKFVITMMAWAIWSFIGVTQDFFLTNNGTWGLLSISAVFGITVGSTFSAGLTRVLGVAVSGAWAIVAWLASRYGSRTAYLPCLCCIGYFVVSHYVSFYVPWLAPAGPVMIISFSSVLFTAYNSNSSTGQGTSLGWKHVAVNAVAIAFVFIVSALFLPYRARTALRRRLADLIRLNSLTVQSVNYMHVAQAVFPTVHSNERRRVEAYIYRSRIQIAKCRGLLAPAAREPSVHERFQASAHRRLIDTLELQLEWLMYSYFSIHHSPGQARLAWVIRQVLAMREDVIGAKTVFNSMLASALHAKSKLPAYLPDIGTARHQFIAHVLPLLAEDGSRGFDVTYLSRWNVGILHLIASQADLCSAVRTIVGAETDQWPEELGAMLDRIELLPHDDLGAEAEMARGQWFRRLPKYCALRNL